MRDQIGNGTYSEGINDALKGHVTAAEDWHYREFAQLLHDWAERFNQEFELGIATPAIQIDRIRARALGTYRYGRNGFGLRHEVTFNMRYLVDYPIAHLLETLLHELLHEWQELHGKPGKGNYHNVEFREKAQSLGLIADQWGHSLGVLPGLFTNLLERHGVNAMALFLLGEEPVRRWPSGESKMKKWTCGCTNIRAAVRLEAQCLKCGMLFRLGRRS